MTRWYAILPSTMLCCLLWGSAFPSIKIGYKIFGIDSSDNMSQLLFAGIRFTLAGLMVIISGSIIQKKFLHPLSGNTLLNINLIDAQKILEADRDPSKYPDLVVRVTGFTAFFSMLSPDFRALVVDRVKAVNGGILASQA